MRWFCGLWCFLVLTCFCWGQSTSTDEYFFRGEIFKLKTVSFEGSDVLSLEDAEVKRLIATTAARLQFSTSGDTLYVYLPGRESSWTNGLAVYSRDGVEREAPGRFFARPATMEPAALLDALGLRAYPVNGGFQLASLITKVSQVRPDSLEMQILTSAPLKHVVTEPELGVVRVELPGAAWGGAERKFRLGEADVEVLGGDKAGLPVMMEFRFLPFWTAHVKLGLTRELLVRPEPRHFTPPAEQAQLSEVRILGKEVEFVFDRPVQFFWALQDQRLTVEFPAARSSLPNVTLLKGEGYPVSRFQTDLEEGDGFEFYQLPERPQSLCLKMGTGVKSPELTGTGSMSGYLGGGGSGTIVLDAGHGGGDPGCRNRYLGVYEKDVTLDICLRLQRLLQERGWQVEMTRSTDRDVTYVGSPDLMELKARADVANRISADLFVSIHCNASVSPSVRGSSIYWWKPQDRLLAQNLDVLDESLGFEQDGLIQNNFAVLRLTSMPAVLVETAFLTNPVEGALLAKPQIRQRIAEKLADGLGQYMASQARRR